MRFIFVMMVMMLMMLKRQVPTMFTLMNLLCGLGGLIFFYRGCLEYIFYFTCLAGVLDALDGASARLLRAYTYEGKILDSLADLVSFGVVPSLVFYTLILRQDPLAQMLALSGLSVALAAALRLARFSAASDNDSVFLGMPTPSIGLFLASIPLLFVCSPDAAFLFPWPDVLGQSISELVCAQASFFLNPWSLAIVCWLCVLLMLVPLPMLSLKFAHPRWKGNRRRYIFLLCGLIFLFVLKVYVFVGLIPLYALFSLGNSMVAVKKT